MIEIYEYQITKSMIEDVLRYVEPKKGWSKMINE